MTETVEEPLTQKGRQVNAGNANEAVVRRAGQNIAPEDNRFDPPLTDYLEYFGLSLDPFETNTGPLFQGGEREAMLSQLLHLSQFGSSVSVVMGDAGVGKTCFRYALLDYLESQDLVCELEIPAISSLDQILLEIAHQFGLQAPKNDTEQLFNLIQQFGAQVEDGDPLKLICVDDAHHLDDFSLERLVELAQPVMEGYRHIHLVFFGEPQLRERFSRINKKKVAANQSVLFQFLVVKPLSIGELKDYLRFRLDNVGFDGLLPFKDEDVQFLWDISQGVPAALHDAAREILIELAMPPPGNKSIGLPPAHMTLVTVLVVGLLIAVFYQSRNEEEQITQNPTAEQLAEDQRLAQQSANQTDSDVATRDTNLEAVTIPQVGQAPQVTIEIPAPSFEQNPQSNAETANSTPVTSRDNVPAVQSESGVKSPASSAAAQAPGAPEPSALKPATPKPAAPVPTVPEPTLQPEARSTARNNTSNTGTLLSVAESALLNKPAEAFTLQILAASSLAAAEDFIGRQANAKDLVVYPARRNSKTVYIVVAGNYSTLALARTAVNDLPNEQQKTGPWPRAFSSVQADIREFRER